jgi:hypothetical protein
LEKIEKDLIEKIKNIEEKLKGRGWLNGLQASYRNIG